MTHSLRSKLTALALGLVAAVSFAACSETPDRSPPGSDGMETQLLGKFLVEPSVHELIGASTVDVYSITDHDAPRKGILMVGFGKDVVFTLQDLQVGADQTTELHYQRYAGDTVTDTMNITRDGVETTAQDRDRQMAQVKAILEAAIAGNFVVPLDSSYDACVESCAETRDSQAEYCEQVQEQDHAACEAAFDYCMENCPGEGEFNHQVCTAACNEVEHVCVHTANTAQLLCLGGVATVYDACVFYCWWNWSES